MLQGRPVAVLGGVRIPFCRQNTAYSDVGNLGMSVRTLGALVEKFGLHGQQLGEVAMGAVIKHSSDWNLGREAALSSGLSPLTPGITLQRACGTSLDSINLIATKIATGQIESGVGGGSTPPDADRLRQVAALPPAGRERGEDHEGQDRRVQGLRCANSSPISRRRAAHRQVDGRALRGHGEGVEHRPRFAGRTGRGLHHKLAAAYDAGFFDDLVVSFRGVSRDNILRPDSSLEKLATLAAFDKTSGRGTLTAGNSTPLTDGAAARLLSSDEWAAAHGHEVLCHLRDVHVAAVDFVHGEGLLMAPTVAVAEMRRATASRCRTSTSTRSTKPSPRRCCARCVRESEDYSRTRLHLEAPLGRIDPEKINPVGSSLAAGHPFAATGARIVATAAKQLKARGGGRALISICTAGGMGVVAILER